MTKANEIPSPVVSSSAMNNLGPLGLLAIAIGVAAFLVLVGAIPVLIVRNLITRRRIGTHVKEWLLYVLSAALVIIAFAGFYFYAENKGIAEYTVIKWLNIFITAVFVFGNAVKRFWRFRNRWTFWAELSVLVVAHFALLSRFRWEQGSYFWLTVIIGIPELVVVFFLLLMSNSNGSQSKEVLSGQASSDNLKS